MSVVSTSMGCAYSCGEGPFLAYLKFIYTLFLSIMKHNLSMIKVILVIIFLSAQCDHGLKLFYTPWSLFYYKAKALRQSQMKFKKINSPTREVTLLCFTK